MKKLRYFTLPLAIWLTFFSAVVTAESEASHDLLPQYQYVEQGDPLAQVNQARKEAVQAQKKLLVVFGANWCHDSMALASQFSNPEVHEVLQANFITQFVDVGYYKDLRAVTSSLGYPGYYATPTVLVVEPDTGELLNRDDVRRWQAAASLGTNEFIAGLSDYANRQVGDVPKHNPQIIAYAQQQTERLQQAFSVLGPMLRAYDDETLEDKARFEATWREVRDFRNQLQLDLQSLWQGEKQVAELAAQVPFSWE